MKILNLVTQFLSIHEVIKKYIIYSGYKSNQITKYTSTKFDYLFSTIKKKWHSKIFLRSSAVSFSRRRFHSYRWERDTHKSTFLSLKTKQLTLWSHFPFFGALPNNPHQTIIRKEGILRIFSLMKWNSFFRTQLSSFTRK